MTLSLLPGATSGLAAAALVAVGLLILLPLSIRLLFVIRRPGAARIAKGFAVAALVLVICGTGLFLAADLTDEYPSFRHLLDSATPVLAGLTVVLSAALGLRAGVRSGRRRGASGRKAESASTGTAAEPEPKAAEPPTAAPG